MRVKCEKGHIWEASFGSIYYQKYWCSDCKKEEKKKLYFEKLKKYIKQKGGECLLDKYINARTKIKIRCENDHIWESTSDNIINKGAWCQRCYFDKKKNTIEDVRKFIESKGGKLLNRKYKGPKQKLRIKCEEGHIWETCYNCIRDGSWCSECYRLSRFLTNEEKLKGFNRVCEIAESKKGKCLSKLSDYKNTMSKLLFECFKEHRWNVTEGHIRKDK